VDFLEADRRYIDLKRQYDNGELSDQEFRTRLEQIAVQDSEGRWWAKHRDTGEWYYQQGDAWIQGTPPYDKPEDSGHKTGGVISGTGSGASGVSGSGGRSTTERETPDRTILFGIVAAVAGLVVQLIMGSYPSSGFVVLLALLLPVVGFYFGDRASRRGNTLGGNATKILSIVCLIVVLIRYVLAYIQFYQF
jgi:hypothetical protein